LSVVLFSVVFSATSIKLNKDNLIFRLPGLDEEITKEVVLKAYWRTPFSKTSPGANAREDVSNDETAIKLNFIRFDVAYSGFIKSEISLLTFSRPAVD